ncbi:MAG: bifunctional adenosylcobinamide kinase/adenosylcobinamide-phosphate guanylyltransferase [Chloroflexi bacterium RBG_16_50_11]|nr:MAG: bifunctional adenosylcobinamide kinase/adenosylcobinamide-phosphate guanylyltransferase [Chloroflexi bacterium RBG_16_50_11]
MQDNGGRGLKSILITGGARSGKSRLAQELAAKAIGKVLFVATAEVGDEEMKRRISLHRKSRPKDWVTLEVTTHIGSRITKNIGPAKTVIIDCITLLVSNVFLQYDEKTEAQIVEKTVVAEINKLIDCIKKTEADFIIVTNEVGLGIIPGDKVSRLYRDLLGKANQMLAQHVNEVYFMVAGIPVYVKKK